MEVLLQKINDLSHRFFCESVERVNVPSAEVISIIANEAYHTLVRDPAVLAIQTPQHPEDVAQFIVLNALTLKTGTTDTTDFADFCSNFLQQNCDETHTGEFSIEMLLDKQ